jgi:hypothetical protein
MVLTDFLHWLRKRYADRNQPLTQFDIAKRTGISQGWLSKIGLGGATRWGDPDTFRLLFDAYPDDWKLFVRTHPDAAREIRETFGWVLAVLHHEGVKAAESPHLEQAMDYLDIILRNKHLTQVALQRLRAIAQLAGQEDDDVGERRTRR